MTILGIDPGYGRIGWGVIEGEYDRYEHVAHGCIETDNKKKLSQRLVELENELLAIIEKYSPNAACVEELFFSKNVSTALPVAHARGVIVLTLQKANLEMSEMTPVQIKQSLTGYGNAKKHQVQHMVSMMLSLPEKRFQDDAADALAIALSGAPELFRKLKNQLN